MWLTLELVIFNGSWCFPITKCNKVLLAVLLPILSLSHLVSHPTIYLSKKSHSIISHLKSYPTSSYPTPSYFTSSYPTQSYPTPSYFTSSYPTQSYPTHPIPPHPISSHPVLSHPILSHFILSHPILPNPSYLTSPHPIPPHPISSHPVVSHPILSHSILSDLILPYPTHSILSQSILHYNAIIKGWKSTSYPGSYLCWLPCPPPYIASVGCGGKQR